MRVHLFNDITGDGCSNGVLVSVCRAIFPGKTAHTFYSLLFFSPKLVDSKFTLIDHIDWPCEFDLQPEMLLSTQTVVGQCLLSGL